MKTLVTYDEFKPKGKNNKKYQIIIINSSRKFPEYLVSLQNRHFGKYNKIPNYIITNQGIIHQLLSDEEYSSIFKDENINKNSIIICLENLGWLNKEPLKDYYINWIGNIYKGVVFDRKWREHFFWEPYKEEQMISLSNLCKDLTKKNSITKKLIGHNTKIHGIEKIKGIVTRSNFDSNFTDVTPAFDFDKFNKLLGNEEFA